MANKLEKYERVGERVSIFRRGRVWHANYAVDGRQIRNSLRTTSLKEARRQAYKRDQELCEGRSPSTPKPCAIDAAVAAYLNHLRIGNRSP